MIIYMHSNFQQKCKRQTFTPHHCCALACTLFLPVLLILCLGPPHKLTVRICSFFRPEQGPAAIPVRLEIALLIQKGRQVSEFAENNKNPFFPSPEASSPKGSAGPHFSVASRVNPSCLPQLLLALWIWSA